MHREISIWGLEGLRNIEKKCIINVDIENNIQIHDQTRYLGINIETEGSIPSGFWKHQQRLIMCKCFNHFNLCFWFQTNSFGFK